MTRNLSLSVAETLHKQKTDVLLDGNFVPDIAERAPHQEVLLQPGFMFFWEAAETITRFPRTSCSATHSALFWDRRWCQHAFWTQSTGFGPVTGRSCDRLLVGRRNGGLPVCRNFLEDDSDVSGAVGDIRRGRVMRNVRGSLHFHLWSAKFAHCSLTTSESCFRHSRSTIIRRF